MGVIRAYQIPGVSRTVTGALAQIVPGSLDLGPIVVGTVQTLTAAAAATLNPFSPGDIVRFSVTDGTNTGRAFAEVTSRSGVNITIVVNEIIAGFGSVGTATAVSIQPTTIAAPGAAQTVNITADNGGFVTLIYSGTGTNPPFATNREEALLSAAIDLTTDITITPVRKGTLIPGDTDIINGNSVPLTVLINS